MENRSHKGTVEVRQSADGTPIIAGYAAVFNRDSSDMGFVEQVDPAAFNRTLKQADVRGLGNHDVNWLLGRVKSGTCRLTVDDTGLRYEIDVNVNDPDGVRALEKVKRGDWDGSSFSFNTIQDQWDWSTSPPQRRLLEVALIDVGPVTFPAYPDATAASRALEPVARKHGRPVDELVAALKTGEIRSLLEPAAEQRATGATVAWGPEDGVNDLLCDLTEALNPVGSRFYALDVKLTLDSALVCDWQSDAYWVVPFTLDAENAPTVAPSSEWVQVEQGWVTTDDAAERTLARLVEQRQGKTISKASAEKIRAAMDQLRELLAGSEADGDPDDGTLLGQALEMDSIQDAKEKNSAEPLSLISARAALRQRELRLLEGDAA